MSATATHMRVFRSLMFTPGQRKNMVEKALALGTASPDALLLDLEDAVPPAEKDAARSTVAMAIRRQRQGGLATPALIVRVNSRATGRQEDDIRAVVCADLTGILLPKVERPDEVRLASALLDDLERRAGMPTGSIALVAAIESARAVHDVVHIAEADARLKGLMFGAEDYARDLGLPVVRTGAAWELVFARSAIVNAAAIAGIWAVDQVFMDFRDQDGERRDAIASRQLGFAGKCAIHPDQVPILNEVFTPSAAEVAHARAVVTAFAQARATGLGCVLMGGQVVEQPILDRAERVLRMHEAIASRTKVS